LPFHYKKFAYKRYTVIVVELFEKIIQMIKGLLYLRESMLNELEFTNDCSENSAIMKMDLVSYCLTNTNVLMSPEMDFYVLGHT
jgi:hypothetical protein